MPRLRAHTRQREVASRLTNAHPWGAPQVPEFDPAEIPGYGIEQRLASHIKPQPNGCWYWDGDPENRGRIRWAGKNWVGYRLVFCMFNKMPSLPKGWHVHHMCRHGGCVNPNHLRLLSPADHLDAHAALASRCKGGPEHSVCAKAPTKSGRCDSCHRSHIAAERRRYRRLTRSSGTGSDFLTPPPEVD